MDTVRYYATGRRKTAIARVWIMPGTGTMQVNGKSASDYLCRLTLERIIDQPFRLLGIDGQYDVKATAKGGGLAGQAGALRLGIARALQEMNPEYRGALKSAGLLTRDSRERERKKYGRHGARRGFQWVKR